MIDWLLDNGGITTFLILIGSGVVVMVVDKVRQIVSAYLQERYYPRWP